MTILLSCMKNYVNLPGFISDNIPFRKTYRKAITNQKSIRVNGIIQPNDMEVYECKCTSSGEICLSYCGCACTSSGCRTFDCDVTAGG